MFNKIKNYFSNNNSKNKWVGINSNKRIIDNDLPKEITNFINDRDKRLKKINDYISSFKIFWINAITDKDKFYLAIPFHELLQEKDNWLKFDVKSGDNLNIRIFWLNPKTKFTFSSSVLDEFKDFYFIDEGKRNVFQWINNLENK